MAVGGALMKKITGWRHRQPDGIQSGRKMSDKPSHQIYIGRHRKHGDKNE
ncbi:hypothetical protein TcasGA2_TC008950 [Tribolium castaneum]|uniref:Uncharacterized protein n=1 Tax=Tribolium castaneum TaxID=7070 RepID=D6WQ98_TRICA|nr:hypothetical protein TcasGA2_TC008950 [Tribolium castaneum]